MSVRSIDLGKLNVASVDRLRVTITKDEVAWTGIDSVTFTFEKPDRSTQFSRSASLEAPDTGVWYYDTLTTDFPNVAASLGHWTMAVTVVDGTVTKTFPYDIGFIVGSQP